MVIFLNLEDIVEPPDHWLITSQPDVEILIRGSETHDRRRAMSIECISLRENPNLEKPIVMALGCYPYALCTLK